MNPGDDFDAAGFVKSPWSSRITLYELIVFLLAFCLALKALYFVGVNPTLLAFVSCVTMGLDAVLAIVVIRKLAQSKGAIFVGSAVALGLLSALFSRSMIVIKGVLLVFGAKNESLRRVLNACWLGFALALGIGVLSSAAGLGSTEEFRRDGLGLGFFHPNQAALFATLTILMIAVSSAGSVRELQGNVPRLLFSLLLMVYIWLTGSRSGLAIIVLVLTLALLYERLRARGKLGGDLARTMLCFAAPVTFLFTVGTAALLFDSSLIQSLDRVVTNRIWLNWFALGNFAITPFGQVVDLHIEGVHNVFTGNWNVTTTVDNTYVAGLLSYGVFATAFWLFAAVGSARRAWDEGNSLLFGASIALAFYAFTESQLMDPLLFFPLLGIYAATTCSGQSRSTASRACQGPSSEFLDRCGNS